MRSSTTGAATAPASRPANPARDEGDANLPAIDLALGSAIGLWALRRFGPLRRGLVFTLDAEIAAVAESMGLAVSTADPHETQSGSERLVSVHYPRIFRGELLDRYQAAYNLHPGLLPWGRGFYPVFWALWEGTPAGATFHVMTPRVDAGPVIRQRRVEYDDTDTGFTLHRRVTRAEKALLVDAWRDLGRGRDPLASARAAGPSVAPSPAGPGSYHARAEFERLRDGREAAEFSAEDLLRLARCLTFPGHAGLRVRAGSATLELVVRNRAR